MAVRLSDDARTLANAAAVADRVRRDCDRANRAMADLDAADDAALRAIVDDRARPALDRLPALAILTRRLRPNADGALAALLVPLWDDPDEEVAATALRAAPASDPGVAAALRARLDAPESRRWSEAATTLARHGDRSIIPRLRDWFGRGDTPHRNVAWACLCFYGLLDGDAALTFLRDAWAAGGRDDDDRLMIAEGLLRRGDRSGWEFLVGLARRADVYGSVHAAHLIAESDWPLGRDLMIRILDRAGPFRVRWGMVERVARLANLPHCWTADGPAEARAWLETRADRPETLPREARP